MSVDMKKLAYWNAHQLAWLSSGLSQSNYCLREGVNWSTFGYWRRITLKLETAPALEITTTPVADAPPPAKAPAVEPMSRKIVSSGAAPISLSNCSLSNNVTLVPLQVHRQLKQDIAVPAVPTDILLRSPSGWQVTLPGGMRHETLLHLLLGLGGSP